MFARFSTVAGERGGADAKRDIRGAALKFYAEDGNWDIAGNNTPIVLLPRSLEISRFEPRNQARPANRDAKREQQLGFLDTATGSTASRDNYHVRPRNSKVVPAHALVRQPHVSR